MATMAMSARMRYSASLALLVAQPTGGTVQWHLLGLATTVSPGDGRQRTRSIEQRESHWS
jgi:hypothetical protein